MDTTDTDSERREMVRRDRAAEKRKREIDDAERDIRRQLEAVLLDALETWGLTWYEAMDCMGEWWDAENKSKHSPPKKKENAR